MKILQQTCKGVMIIFTPGFKFKAPLPHESSPLTWKLNIVINALSMFYWHYEYAYFSKIYEYALFQDIRLNGANVIHTSLSLFIHCCFYQL